MRVYRARSGRSAGGRPSCSASSSSSSSSTLSYKRARGYYRLRSPAATARTRVKISFQVHGTVVGTRGSGSVAMYYHRRSRAMVAAECWPAVGVACTVVRWAVAAACRAPVTAAVAAGCAGPASAPSARARSRGSGGAARGGGATAVRSPATSRKFSLSARRRRSTDTDAVLPRRSARKYI